jgi:hypothetical protein
MKKLLLILSLIFIAAVHCYAQDENSDNEKIRDKMTEFIQKRLNLSKNEAERFTPVFLRYFREWRTALRENKGDMLMKQQKIVEIRLRYRNEFKEIVGERRSNEIYVQQEIFITKLRDLRNENMPNRERPARRFRSALE